MSNINITINDKDINERLNHIYNALNMSRGGVMDVVAQILHAQTMKTFDNEGDPAGSWAPLAKATLRDRKAKGYASGPILQRSQRLKRSVMASARIDYAQIAIAEPYAAAHHFGAQIKCQGFIRLRTKNKSGELLRQKEHDNLAVFASNKHKRAVTRAVNYVINIPARPILPIDENQRLKPSAKKAIFDGISQILLKAP